MLKGEEVIREEGLEGRKRYECAYMCPRCGGERETVSHMFGGCSGNQGVLDKFNSETREHLKIQVPWVENMVGWAIGGVNMVRHEGGLWGIIRGELEGQVVTQEEEGGQRASFEKVRECPQWLINAGLGLGRSVSPPVWAHHIQGRNIPGWFRPTGRLRRSRLRRGRLLVPDVRRSGCPHCRRCG